MGLASSASAITWTGSGASGDVLERYEYDAYGNCNIEDANHDSRTTSHYQNPYLFTGRRVDILDSGSLKIQYNRNRYYDYYTGRWLTHDPPGYVDGMNLYEYAKSSPVTKTDQLGTSAVDCQVTRHRSRVRVTGWVPLRISVGHDWFEYPHGSMGFWPRGSIWSSDSVVLRPDPYEGTRDKNWHTMKSDSCKRKLEYGSGKGKKCKCAICNEVLDCLQKLGDYWDAHMRFKLLTRNCRHFVKAGLKKCCLKTGKKF